QDRKRNIFGLPWTFTKYQLSEKKLLIQSGILNRKEEEIRLYRIMDVTLKRTLLDQLFGIGTIHCCSADKSTPEFEIIRIKNAGEVKNQLSDLIEKERTARRVGMRELMDDGENEEN
ncbi:MAG: PH domain-containing protein, partial [Angelakisella sp.]